MSGVLDGMKLLLAVPTYGHPDPKCQKDVRLSMMVASKHGVEWAGDVSPDRMGYATARNVVAQSLLSMDPEEANGVVWIDSDIRSQPSDLARLLAAAVRFKALFVSGVYHQRGAPYAACFYEYRKKTKKFASLKDYPLDVFAPFDGCGFGFCYTHRQVIEDIARSKNFNRKKGWFPDERDTGGFGEDLSFCYQAMNAGHQLYVDTGVLLGHTGDPDVIYREQALARRPFHSAEETFNDNDWGIPE